MVNSVCSGAVSVCALTARHSLMLFMQVKMLERPANLNWIKTEKKQVSQIQSRVRVFG